MQKRVFRVPNAIIHLAWGAKAIIRIVIEFKKY